MLIGREEVLCIYPRGLEEVEELCEGDHVVRVGVEPSYDRIEFGHSGHIAIDFEEKFECVTAKVSVPSHVNRVKSSLD